MRNRATNGLSKGPLRADFGPLADLSFGREPRGSSVWLHESQRHGNGGLSRLRGRFRAGDLVGDPERKTPAKRDGEMFGNTLS